MAGAGDSVSVSEKFWLWWHANWHKLSGSIPFAAYRAGYEQGYEQGYADAKQED